MKTEQEIRERIQNLCQEGSLTSLIMVIILLWVLDTNTGHLNRYISLLDMALKEIATAILPMEPVVTPETEPLA